jgi:hypothetical protein
MSGAHTEVSTANMAEVMYLLHYAHRITDVRVERDGACGFTFVVQLEGFDIERDVARFQRLSQYPIPRHRFYFKDILNAVTVKDHGCDAAARQSIKEWGWL